MQDLKLLLEKAVIMALKVHNNQLNNDKTPYITHPIAVMNNVLSIESKIVAILHDVIEDGYESKADYIGEMYQMGLPTKIIDAIIAITHRPKNIESYESYLLRCKENPLAREVKIADIEHNMNPQRLATFNSKEKQKRIDKYTNALNIMTTK
jgi:(p)ppGpp synthase/HD superfamily hydrolase